MDVQSGAFRTRFFDKESLQGSQSVIDDYNETVGERRPCHYKSNHQQVGNPDKAGEVIVKVMNSDEYPQILTLGKEAVTTVKSILEAKIKELDK